jgi:hypothetical protein
MIDCVIDIMTYEKFYLKIEYLSEYEVICKKKALTYGPGAQVELV